MMSARAPRRSFARPFVITLAACGAPQPTQPSTPTTTEAKPVDACPCDEPVHSDAPPPPPAASDSKWPTGIDLSSQAPGEDHQRGQQWTVVKRTADTCLWYATLTPALYESVCHGPCNPPKPFSYACPIDLSIDEAVRVQAVEPARCVLMREVTDCPPRAICHPATSTTTPHVDVTCPP